jgi:hypothetical protein
MKKLILVLGRHPEIVATVLRLINATDQWEAQGCIHDREAIQVFDQVDFDMVLLGSGISPASEAILCGYFRDKKPGIKIIQHYGGGSGLLFNEIVQALQETEPHLTKQV